MTGQNSGALQALAGADVEFAGWVDEGQKWRLLAQAWALVHPSHHEGWGIVIVEAASVGTPSIGFRVPGVKDAIMDDETGILVDSQLDLAEQWIRLTKDSELRERMSLAGREYAKSFAWEGVVRDFESIASAAVESGGRAPR